MSIIQAPYHKIKRWIVGIVIFLCLYSLVGFVLIPWLITSQTPVLIKQQLGREASLDAVKFNPYTLELDLNGFEMLEHDNQAFASFDHLYINYGFWSSISHFSVALQQVLLEKPYVHIDILKDGSFNFSDLSSDTEEENENEQSDGLFPVWVADLAIQNGTVSFEDHSLKTTFSEQIKQLNLDIKALSTKKDASTAYHLMLALASGANVDLSGDTILDPLSADGHLQLSNLSLHKMWEYLRDSVDFELQKGNLAINGHYSFDGSHENKSILDVSDGSIAVGDFRFITTTDDPTQIDLTKLDLKKITVNLVSGSNNQTIDIAVPLLNSKNTQITLQGTDALAITLPDFALSGTKIDIASSEVNQTSIKITNQKLAMSKLGIETSGIRELFVKISDIAFNDFNMDIVNSDDSDQTVMKLENQNLSLNNTTIGSTTDNTAVIEIPNLSLDKLGVDVIKQSVTISNIRSDQARINSWLARDGALNLQTLFAGKPENTETTTQKTTATASEESTTPEWSVAINTLALSNYWFSLEDQNTKPAAQFTLRPMNLTINQFSTDFSKPFQLDFKTDINKKGNFSTNGTVAIEPLKVDLNIAASKVALDALQPYVNDFARLKIKNGHFNMNGKLNLRTSQSSKTAGSFKGDANIAGLRTVDTINNKDFLKWKALNVNGIDFNLQPMKLAIRDVVTDRLYNRVIINKDKTTNLGEIFPTDPDSQTKSKQKEDKKHKQPNNETVPLKIGIVKIKNSAALFSDLSLVLPFALNMTDLNGAIKDISSSTAQTASVKVDGKVNRISPVVIEGSLKPFDIEQFMDVKLSLKDVDLTAITPYMAQFAGYAIEKGKINLDLEYKIKDKKLLAENNVVIDQLTLGEEIESPDAVSLPVKLAIGLLQDQNGVIDLDLPMQGSLDDPEFSIGALIGKVLINLLTKAATSPFSLIGGLVGSADDMSGIVFARGTSKLDNAQIEKLDKITEALNARPKLKIEIKGLAITETDRLGLKENRLLAKMKKIKWREIKGDDNAPSESSLVELSDKDRKQMIAELYQDEIPDAQSPQTTKSETGEDIIPDNYYHMARKSLLDQIQISDLDLQQLAQERANNIAHQLIQVGGLPANRIFVLKETIEQQANPEPEKTVTVKLALSAS
ncbi:MAG TPA: DUF748 domain-containing protein [Crenotrichaceae bacterium]|nr:DUF748 domain-containing protein [Crenotrichaceae bacterium]